METEKIDNDDKNPKTNEINPFVTEWLAENFGLNVEDVIKAKFNDLKIFYGIEFKDLKSKQLVLKILKEKICPILHEYGNHITLSEFAKKDIVNAAQNKSTTVRWKKKRC